MKCFIACILCCIVIGCSPVSKLQKAPHISSLKFLGVQDVEYNLPFAGTTLGGLSGIDYDAKRKIYYLICDDRSDINPARFYTATINFSEAGFEKIKFDSVYFLKSSDGNTYPNNKQDAYHVPDPEAIRYDAKKDQLVWSSEGERIVKAKTILLDPSVHFISLNGAYRDSFSLPVNMHMHGTEEGPRQNGVFEGLAFANHYKNLYVSVEEPLYDDGPRASTGDSSGLTRIICYNVHTKKQKAQYGYRIEPVAYPPNPPGAFKLNGIPDILWIGKKKLLVMERSYSVGFKPSVIRIFLADLKKAKDIKNIHSIYQSPRGKACPKKIITRPE